jgi:hypothetical protein
MRQEFFREIRVMRVAEIKNIYRAIKKSIDLFSIFHKIG